MACYNVNNCDFVYCRDFYSEKLLNEDSAVKGASLLVRRLSRFLKASAAIHGK